MKSDGKPDGAPPTIRSALATIYDAIRAGYGPAAKTARDEAPDFGHDPRFLEDVKPLLDFLYAKYFRVRAIDADKIPASGSAILVANHSGGVPYDGAMLIYSVFKERQRRLRPLVATFAFRAGWMSNVVARIGGVRASADLARRLLAAGELVGVFPEGLRGVGKLYRERYRLERFGRGGFVRLARDAGVPIIPVAIVGAEEIHPVLAKVTTLAEPLGLPYIPITPTFPWLGPFGLLPVPTKWTIQFGDPIYAPGPDSGKDAIANTAEAVRGRIDSMIAALLTRRRSILFG